MEEFEKELKSLCKKYGLVAGVYARSNEDKNNATVYLVSDEEQLNQNDIDVLFDSLYGFMVSVFDLAKDKLNAMCAVIQMAVKVSKHYISKNGEDE